MPKLLTERARQLRKTMTDAERRLWSSLRRRQVEARFRRQAPIGPYIVDFVSFEDRLVIELDGGQHTSAKHVVYDANRTAFLEMEGFRVIRFWNTEVLQNLPGVLEAIAVALKEMSPPSCPSPTRGEGTV